MLQRPQSICLLFVALALLTMLLVPIWTKTVATTTYTLSAWYLDTTGPGLQQSHTSWPCFLLGLLALSVAAIATYTLFRYDNRPLQRKLGLLNAFMMALLLGLMLYLILQQPTAPDALSKYQLGYYLPMLGTISNFLANHFISKDERRVKAAERIR